MYLAGDSILLSKNIQERHCVSMKEAECKITIGGDNLAFGFGGFFGPRSIGEMA